jgi:hypothetical protein
MLPWWFRMAGTAAAIDPMISKRPKHRERENRFMASQEWVEEWRAGGQLLFVRTLVRPRLLGVIW